MAELISGQHTPGRLRFRPSLFVTVVTILFVALTVGLGRWQTGRARDKDELQQRLDILATSPPEVLPTDVVADGAPWAQHPVAGRGRYQGGTFLLDNRIYNGAPGYHVISPFCPDSPSGGGLAHACVLINRGWVSVGERRDVLPQVSAPDGETSIEGTATLPPADPYELGTASSEGAVIQHLIVARLAARTGLALQPFVLEQTGSGQYKPADNLVRDWSPPGEYLTSERHRAYALTWYAMAAVGIALWVGINLKRTGKTGQHGAGQDNSDADGVEGDGR